MIESSDIFTVNPFIVPCPLASDSFVVKFDYLKSDFSVIERNNSLVVRIVVT